MGLSAVTGEETSGSKYFAEAWTAYHFDPQALRGHSQEVYSMVQNVLKEAGLL